MMRAYCHECGRVVGVRRNRFGDLCYARHKMSTIYAADEEEFDGNRAVSPLWEIDCPASWQVVDDEDLLPVDGHVSQGR